MSCVAEERRIPPLLHRLRDLRLDDAIERIRVHRPDHHVGDHAIAPHDRGRWNAINPPIDAGAAGAVEADFGVGVAGGAEKRWRAADYEEGVIGQYSKDRGSEERLFWEDSCRTKMPPRPSA